METTDFKAITEEITQAVELRESKLSELYRRREEAQGQVTEAKARMEAAENDVDGAAYVQADQDRGVAQKTVELLTMKIDSIGDIPTKHKLAREVKETADRLRRDKVAQAGPILEQLEAVVREYDTITVEGNALLRKLRMDGQYVNPWFRELCRSTVDKYRRYTHE